MKENLKVFGFEIIYLLTTLIVAAGSFLIQLIGRSYSGECGFFIFDGSEYTYNIIFYNLGMVIYISFMIAGYRFFLKKRIAGLSGLEIAVTIVFPIIALVFSVFMFILLLVVALMVLEFDNMKPISMFEFTLFGWPVICMGFMIYAEVDAIKTDTGSKDITDPGGDGKTLIKEWNEVVTDADIENLNKIYNYFEDSMIVSMNYISGNSVDENLHGNMLGDNDLKIVFQRPDKDPFSVELWFTHTRQMRMLFVNPSDKCQMDIMKAKVCRNERSLFWTMWEDFDPDNEEHKNLSDVAYIEAEGLKWRIIA
jgi:hypothetical protein